MEDGMTRKTDARIALSLLTAAALAMTLVGCSGGGSAQATDTEPIDLEANTERIRILLYRSYLPTGGRDAVPLPDVTIVENGEARTLPVCPNRESSPSADLSGVRDAFASGDVSIAQILERIAAAVGVPKVGKFPYCSWWTVTDIDNFNIAFPDANATYWAQPLLTSEDAEVYVDGVYPNERYMSFVLYNQTLDFYDYMPAGGSATVHSYITDYQINPDPGSQNPWQVAAAPGGSYRVTIKPDPQVGEANVLPWFDNTTTVQEQLTGGSFPIPPPCGREDSISACTIPTQFLSPPTDAQSSIFSNPDNGYLPTLFSLDQEDRVYVIRGKAPTAPAGTSPVPWDPDGTQYQLRYWSMCNSTYLRPYPSVTGQFPPDVEGGRYQGCVADYQVPLDADGMFTLVLSTEEARPERQKTETDTAWIKAIRGPKNLLNYRHMLPVGSFQNAVQNVPRTGSFVDAMMVMGPFYPLVTVECTTSHYEENGWGGCVAPKVDTNPDGPGNGPGLPGVGGP
jgi:hypothetical protein